mgnify:CR=1 FL=1
MAKQSGGKPQIDEDFMKEIISQGLPVKKQETPTVTVKTEIETPVSYTHLTLPTILRV